MAGSYPDAPGPRMALDLDGSVAVKISSTGVITTCTTTERQNTQDESVGTYVQLPSSYGVDTALVWIFPELRDFDGYHIYGSTVGGVVGWAIEWSADTTTGLDGTWTLVESMSGPYYATVTTDPHRTVTAASISGARAVRARSTGANGLYRIYSFHLYGTPSATSDRLALWHPTLDEPVDGAYFDWGDVPQNTSETRQFRIKNLSTTLTATTITLSTSALTNASPSLLTQHTFSTDGSTYGSTATIASLDPEGISSVCYLQRILGPTAQLGLWALRMSVQAASWA